MTAASLAFRSYEFWLAYYRRVWRGSVATSVVNPVFYLAALGIGLGTLVNHSASRPGHVSYVDFVAPGLLAAAAMQTAAGEASFPILAAIKWTRQYQAMLATPLGIRDIFLGHQLFIVTRVLISSAIYLAVIAAFGMTDAMAALSTPVPAASSSTRRGPSSATRRVNASRCGPSPNTTRSHSSFRAAIAANASTKRSKPF